MAMYDVNHDGKKDWVDNAVEYQMYKRFQEGKRNGDSGGGNKPSLGTPLLVVAILLLCGFVFQSCTHEESPAMCQYGTCTEDAEEDSKYCYEHEDIVAMEREEATGTDQTTGRSTSMTTTANRFQTTTEQSKSESIYPVDEYDDPGDFYEDYKDDFDTFDDALEEYGSDQY